MTSPKPVTPYARLLATVRTWESRVVYPRSRSMWTYQDARDGETMWSMNVLYERTKAADQLGYDVRLIAQEDGGLLVQYVRRPGSLDV